jgi:hypothetical protein
VNFCFHSRAAKKAACKQSDTIMKTSHTPFISAIAFAAVLCLFPQIVCAGVVAPNRNVIDWMDPTAWAWQPDHQAKADPINQIPQPGDTVVVSRQGGVDVTLSDTVLEIAGVVVGAVSEKEQANEFVLRLVDGGALRANALTLGRSGPKGFGSSGRLVMDPGSQCEVRAMQIGTAVANDGLSHNGFLDLAGGELSVHSLAAGTAGADYGSVISVKGSQGRMDVSKKAVLHGPNLGENAAGVTLEFVLDEKGVSPIYVNGDAEFVNQPKVKVDVSKFSPSKLPSAVTLIDVSGNRSGEPAEAEIVGLSQGQMAVVEWNEQDQLLLKITK